VTINIYYSDSLSKQDILSGFHRDNVGGMWDKIGKLQFDFMLQQGLKPDMNFLDVGCGCLRGGVHFIRYLNAGNYYGIDLNQSLIEAGYEVELNLAGLKEKIPKTNLLINDRFQASLFGVEFDFALAHSLFTHLPMNHIKRCFIELAKCVKRGGEFYATFFEVPPNESIEMELLHQPGGIITHLDKDPYHYRVKDFSWCVEDLPWEISYYGDWKHPRTQKMLRCIRQ
jgi:SAM-dependent methyltransferase